MAKGHNTYRSKPTQVTVVLRFIAGGYLVYLAYSLLQEYLKPTGGGQLVQIGSALLFFVCGGVIGGWSVMRFVKGDYLKHGELPDEDGPEAAGGQKDEMEVGEDK